MHDAAPKYEPDTFVFDVEDPPAMPAIGRVSTEDLVAHVILDGQRHRRTPDLRDTACGVPIHSGFHPPLRDQLTFVDGEPCPVCFTPHEIRRAAENDAAAANADDELQKRMDAETAERDRRGKEFTTGAMAALRRRRPSSQGEK